jgi:hypothetical protein
MGFTKSVCGLCFSSTNALLLAKFQLGLRRGHSSISALVKITDDLGAAKADGEDVVLVILDFSKAFDCIPHDLL